MCLLEGNMAYEISADWVKNTDENTPPFLGAESSHEDFGNWSKVIQDVLSCVLNTEEGMRVAFVCADQQDYETLMYACRSFVEDCFRGFGGHCIYKEELQEIGCYFSSSCLFVPIKTLKATDIYDEVYKTFCKLLKHRCPQKERKSKKNNKNLSAIEMNFDEDVNKYKEDILQKLQYRQLLLKVISLPEKEEIENYKELSEASDVLKIKKSLEEMEKSISNVIDNFISIYGAPKVIFFLISLPMEEYEKIKNESVLFPGFTKLAIKCETLPYEKNKAKDFVQKESALYNTTSVNEKLSETFDIKKSDDEMEKELLDTIQEDLYTSSSLEQSTGKENIKNHFENEKEMED